MPKFNIDNAIIQDNKPQIMYLPIKGNCHGEFHKAPPATAVHTMCIKGESIPLN